MDFQAQKLLSCYHAASRNHCAPPLNVKRHQSNKLLVWLYRAGQVILAHPSNKLTSISNLKRGQSLNARCCSAIFLSEISLLRCSEVPCACRGEVPAYLRVYVCPCMSICSMEVHYRTTATSQRAGEGFLSVGGRQKESSNFALNESCF